MGFLPSTVGEGYIQTTGFKFAAPTQGQVAYNVSTVVAENITQELEVRCLKNQKRRQLKDLSPEFGGNEIYEGEQDARIDNT